MSDSQKIDRAKQLQIFRLSQELDPATGLPYSVRKISLMVGVSRDSVEKYSGDPPVVPETPQTPKADRIEEFAKYHRERFLELQERFNKWIGNTEKPAKPPKRKSGKCIKAVTFNDIHAPFHNEEAFARAINETRDCDECWIAGDILDMWAFSRYPKKYAKRRKFSPVEELQSGQVIFNKLSETYPTVRVLKGSNHQDRVLKYLQSKGVPPDILEYFSYAYPGFEDPQSKLLTGLSNVQLLPVVEHGYAEYPWFAQIGDAILTHAEKYSRIPNRAVGDIISWLMKTARPMKLLKADPRIVGQAHTHAAGKTWNDYGIVGLEMGTLSMTPDYAGDAKSLGRMPVLGYTIFVQNDGVTDINSSNFFQIG